MGVKTSSFIFNFIRCFRGGDIQAAIRFDQIRAVGNAHVICRKRCSGRALEFGDRFVEIGLRLEFASAGGDQFGLSC